MTRVQTSLQCTLLLVSASHHETYVLGDLPDQGCTMPASRAMTGYVAMTLATNQKFGADTLIHSSHTGLDCSSAVNSNAGCGASVPDGGSYGPAFNANGGGWCDTP